jgi:site-specific DNA-methyltransferase (adenine-specific)
MRQNAGAARPHCHRHASQPRCGSLQHHCDASIKSGKLKADDIRSLMAVREREGAEIALFVSLEEPTRGMVADAASAGFYESATGKKYARVQLLTIEGLLSGQQRAEHPDQQPDLNFKKARAESNTAQKPLL